ncbi:MAG: hypothetical protein WA510_17055 [Acidobacteriaceae bacterium]
MSKLPITIMLLLTPLLLAQQILSNDGVIKLKKAGFSEDVIVSTIQRSRGTYDTSVDGLIALKNAGLTDAEISAIIARASGVPQNPQITRAPSEAPAVRASLAVPTQTVLKPRVLLKAPNRNGGWSTLVDQAKDMSKDFQEACPGARVSINLYMADYTVELNHIEHGYVPENQMLIANKDGDVISRVHEWGGIKGGVKKACAAILADWAKR